MAILFNDALSQYLQADNWPGFANEPISLACWFYLDDDAASQVLVSVADRHVQQDFWVLQARGNVEGNPVRAVSAGTEGFANASTLSGYSANTWHHGLAVFADSDDRRVYIDGGSKGTDNTDITTLAIDTFAIGRLCDSTPGGYTSGRICEVGIWDEALDDDDAAVLAAGYAPHFVRPWALKQWRLMRNVGDLMQRGNYFNPGDDPLTAYNGPVSAEHSRIIHPSPPHVVVPPAVLVWLETGRLFLYTAANWGCPRTWYFETTMYAPVGTARAKLYDLTAAADVANSEITTGSVTKTRVRSAAITLVDGHAYEARFGALPAATCAATGACLVGLAT
jgi:hypothetical protein